jgi:peptide/nickel transport system permease protein
MVTYIVRRLLLALLTTFFISIVAFAIIQLPPGDYVDTYVAQMSSGGGISAEEVVSLRRAYGLDQPIYLQYFRWMGQVLRGEFGRSMEWQRPVSEVIGERLWLTVIVSLAAVMVTWMAALPIGIYSAVNQYSVGDYLFTLLGFIGIAIPNFMLGLILLYVGFKYFNINVGGLFSPEFENAPWSMARAWDLVKHLPLPVLVLSLAGMAQLIRVMRANLLDELRKPYVVTALAKGLPAQRAINKYPVRAALNPFASTVGYLLPFVVSGSIIVSLVMGLPTVGPVLLRALFAQDMFLAGTIVLLLGLLTVIGTFISDLLLMWIEPRIRLGAR